MKEKKKEKLQLTHVPFPETKTLMIIITIYYICLEETDGHVL